MKTAMDIIRDKDMDIISVSPDTLIYDALQVMVDNRIGAILIKNGDRIVGVWTERDLMRNMLDDNFNPRTEAISDHMVSKLRSAYSGDTIYELMDKFFELRLRHLLIEDGGKYIGLVSIGDVIMTLLLDTMKSGTSGEEGWEYYENWKSKIQSEGTKPAPENFKTVPSERSIPLEERFTYDAEKNLFYVNFENFSVTAAYDISKIEFNVASILSPLDKKVFAIVNYDNFSIDPDLIDDYSRMVNRLMEHFYLDVTRYTTSESLRAELETALQKSNVPPHLYRNSQDALRAILKMI